MGKLADGDKVIKIAMELDNTQYELQDHRTVDWTKVQSGLRETGEQIMDQVLDEPTSVKMARGTRTERIR